MRFASWCWRCRGWWRRGEDSAAAHLANIDIYCHSCWGVCTLPVEYGTMASTLNVQLTDELRRHVDMRASDNDVYATPSEYIRDLVRRDMEDWAIVSMVVQGLKEVSSGKFAKETILDILRED